MGGQKMLTKTVHLQMSQEGMKLHQFYGTPKKAEIQKEF
jgi:hypothetical protein